MRDTVLGPGPSLVTHPVLHRTFIDDNPGGCVWLPCAYPHFPLTLRLHLAAVNGPSLRRQLTVCIKVYFLFPTFMRLSLTDPGPIQLKLDKLAQSLETLSAPSHPAPGDMNHG